MQTVVITRFASGFANVPASFMVGDHDKDDDSLVTAATYEVPAGFTVGTVEPGNPAIFDPHGHYCSIVEHPCGRPQLVASERSWPVLNLVG
jgi:hypothetical protein